METMASLLEKKQRNAEQLQWWINRNELDQADVVRGYLHSINEQIDAINTCR